MISKTFLLRPLALAALVVASGASQATITVVTSLAAFNAATTAQGTDTFTGLSIVSSTPSPIFRTAGPYSYKADTAPAGTFFGAGTTADPWLSSNTATDTITFNTFSAGVAAAGGNFFGSNISGAFLAGDVTVTATDGSGTVTQTITGATTSSFIGFISNGSLTSMTLTAVQPASGFLWPTADNITLAAAAPVPEPETYALMLAGLAVVGFMARRRRG